MIKKILNSNFINSKPTQSVAMAAFVISMAGIASRVLGLFRDRILAHQFGAGDTLDIYYAAFRIPDMIYNLLVLGALSAAFIPVFTSLISTDKEEESWKLASGILTLKVIAISVISIILVIFSSKIMRALTPGFSPEKINAAASFTRIMFLSTLFLGISAVFGGILVSMKKFLIYSLAPIMYNIGIIIGAVFFVKFLGPIGLAWGVVLGAFLHMLIQYPAIKFSGFQYQFQIRKIFENKNIMQVIRLMIPRTMGIAVSQINLLVITVFASTLAAGSLAVFNFANNIQSAPLGLFGISFAIAVFPTLSTHAAKNMRGDFVQSFSATLRNILFFIIPLSVFILIFRAQIVRVILGTGEFGWDDTKNTFGVLGILALSLFAQGLIPLLTRSFYALHDSKTPFYVALFSEATNISLVFLLIKKYAIFGLAIAFSAACVVQMILLLAILHARFSGLDDWRIILSVFKISVASFFAGLAAQALKGIPVQFIENNTFLGVLAQLSIAGGTGIAVFIFLSYLFKIEEFHCFKDSLIKKLAGFNGKPKEDFREVSGI